MRNQIDQAGGRCSVGALASGAESAVLSAFSSSSAIRYPQSVLRRSAASAISYPPSVLGASRPSALDPRLSTLDASLLAPRSKLPAPSPRNADGPVGPSVLGRSAASLLSSNSRLLAALQPLLTPIS